MSTCISAEFRRYKTRSISISRAESREIGFCFEQIITPASGVCYLSSSRCALAERG
jgi:hypothetical protein